MLYKCTVCSMPSNFAKNFNQNWKRIYFKVLLNSFGLQFVKLICWELGRTVHHFYENTHTIWMDFRTWSNSFEMYKNWWLITCVLCFVLCISIWLFDKLCVFIMFLKRWRETFSKNITSGINYNIIEGQKFLWIANLKISFS